MSLLDYLLALPWVRPLGWTLVHFLWQGAAIGLVAAPVLRAARQGAPQVRYVSGLCALAICLLAPLATFLVLARPLSVPPPRVIALGNAVETPGDSRLAASGARAEAPVAPSMPRPAQAATPGFPRPATAVKERLVPYFPDLVRWTVPVWLLCVCLLTLRLGISWARVQLWRRKAHLLEDDRFEAALKRLAELLEIKGRIPILISSAVPGPLTLGFFKPVILLPVQLLSGLPPDQIEAILAHELAHIRRHDYVVNLLQSVAEVVLFYHPVIWWLNRQIRRAREECCDELGAACSGRMTYARALASLAEWQAGLLPALGARDGDLFARICRILGRPRAEPVLPGKNAAWFLCLLIATLTAWGIFFSARLIAAEQPMIANDKQAPRGIVVDEAGAPVAGTEVILYYAKNPWGLGNRVLARVRTDSAGRFAFQETLSFECPHGTDSTDHYALFALAESLAPGWRVIVGGTPDEREYRMTVTRPVQQTYEVIDKNGRPAAGATVWLRYAGAQRDKPPLFEQSFVVPEDLGLCSAVTDEQGRATLNNLPNTTYSVAASKPGCEDSMSCTTPKDGVAKFTLVPAATLEGRVTDPLGLPVEGAIVWLYPEFRWHQYFLAKTDAEGRYRVEKIWSNGDQPDWGKYQVGIRHPNFTAKLREVQFSSGQQVTDFHIAAEPGVLLKGRLRDPATGESVAGGSVIVDSASGRQNLKSDRDGIYQCRVLAGDITVIGSQPPGGCYFVEASSNGLPHLVRTRAFGSEFEASVYLGGPMGKLGRLAGKVVSPAGTPAAFAAVKIVPLARILRQTPFFSSAWRGTPANEAGEFESSAVPVGLPFVVLAEAQGDGAAGLAKGEMSEIDQNLAAPIRLEPTGTVQIVLSDRSDKPLANSEVIVTPVLEGMKVFLKEKKLKSNANGQMTIPGVIPGVQYRMELSGTEASDVTLELLSADGRQTASQVALSDKYLVRLTDSAGRNIPIAGFKEYWVWILSEGQKVRWTNDGTIPVLSSQSDGVVVSRRPFLLGRAGDQVDAVIETGEGQLIRAVGYLPKRVSDPLIFEASENLSKTEAQPDPSMRNVKPDEIVGRVLAPDGKPVPKAEISDGRNRHPLPGGSFPVQTNDEGIFRMPTRDGRPPLYLTVLAEGYAPVFLTDCVPGTGFSVTLQNTTRLKGTVGGGNPGTVKIQLEKDKQTKRQNMDFQVRGLQFRTETRPDGTYDFPMEPGDYRYQLSSEDGRYARGEISLGEGQIMAFPAALQKGDSVELLLVDSQTGKPIPGIPVAIMEKLDAFMMGNKAGSDRTSDAEGMVKWDDLMPGKTEFSSRRMFGALGRGESQLPYARWWREEEPDEWRRIGPVPPTGRQGVDPIFVDVQSGLKPVRVWMERGVKISGNVSGADGKPVKGAFVGVVPNEGRRATLTGDSRYTILTDEKGFFEGYLPAGNGIVYNLCAYTWAIKPAAFASAVSEPFSSKPGDEFTFRLRMEKGAYVSGRVLGSDGLPVAGFEVQATNCDDRDSIYADRLTKTDKDGRFRVGPLRAGEYLIQPDTMENINVASIPGFTPPKVRVADEEEKEMGDIALPFSSLQARSSP